MAESISFRLLGASVSNVRLHPSATFPSGHQTARRSCFGLTLLHSAIRTGSTSRGLMAARPAKCWPSSSRKSKLWATVSSLASGWKENHRLGRSFLANSCLLDCATCRGTRNRTGDCTRGPKRTRRGFRGYAKLSHAVRGVPFLLVTFGRCHLFRAGLQRREKHLEADSRSRNAASYRYRSPDHWPGTGCRTRGFCRWQAAGLHGESQRIRTWLFPFDARTGQIKGSGNAITSPGRLSVDPSLSLTVRKSHIRLPMAKAMGRLAATSETKFG